MLIILAAWLIFASLILVALYRKAWWRFWREPVLNRPVMIFESDDWGAGPQQQAARLAQIADCLGAYRDNAGNTPVMTLGVVLAMADGSNMADGNYAEYRALDLGAPQFHALVQAMRAGVARGVFALQLHGMEHYWPATLLTMSRDDETLRAWLKRSPESWTEDLPSPVQSRWCDATVLPSRPLPTAAIQAAARNETQRFAAVFDAPPRVAVPPTFVWNEQVEQAWADAGVKYVVTPGRRNTARSASGSPAGEDMAGLVNGDLAAAGMIYLVRDVYFEPALGHAPQKVVEQIGRAARLGRPTLIETHRFNFVRDDPTVAASLLALGQAIEQALRSFPQIAFLSTESLADKMMAGDAALIERRAGARLAVCLARLSTISRLRKLALLSGAGFLAWVVYRLLHWAYYGKAA